jgi:hypothetical protein
MQNEAKSAAGDFAARPYVVMARLPGKVRDWRYHERNGKVPRMAKRALNVTLPPDLAKMVQDKVASGSYASESDVVSAGLRALQAQVPAWRIGCGQRA